MGRDETDPESDPEAATEADAAAAAAELLRVNEPAAITPRGRPPGAKNKLKKRTREQAFEDSTQRDPSGFEYVQQQQQRQREIITAGEVEEQVENHLLDEFFGGQGSSPTTRSILRGGSGRTTRTSTPRGGFRPMQQPSRRRGRGGRGATSLGERGGATPAWQQGREAMFGVFDLSVW